jgi:hypothetical protein
MEILANILGNIGVLCFLGAYFLLQKQKITYSSFTYLGLNLAGSLLLIVSLVFDWNLPAFLLEAAWALISMYGIYTHIYLPRRGRAK